MFSSTVHSTITNVCKFGPIHRNFRINCHVHPKPRGTIPQLFLNPPIQNPIPNPKPRPFHMTNFSHFDQSDATVEVSCGTIDLERNYHPVPAQAPLHVQCICKQKAEPLRYLYSLENKPSPDVLARLRLATKAGLF